MPEHNTETDAGGRAEDHDQGDELEIVQAHLRVRITECLERCDLPALQMNEAREHDVQQERHDREKQRRHDRRVRRELRELVLDDARGYLAIATDRARSAVRPEQPVQRLGHRRLRCVGLKLERDVVERPVHLKRGGHDVIVHPQDAEALGVGDEVARCRIDVFR